MNFIHVIVNLSVSVSLTNTYTHTCPMFDRAHGAFSPRKSLTSLHNTCLASEQRRCRFIVGLLVAAEPTLTSATEGSTLGTRAQSRGSFALPLPNSCCWACTIERFSIHKQIVVILNCPSLENFCILTSVCVHHCFFVLLASSRRVSRLF